LTNEEGDLQLDYTVCEKADQGQPEKIQKIQTVSDSTIYLRVQVDQEAICHFSYSIDGKHFKEIDAPFTASVGKWIGAKIGLFCSSIAKEHDSGYADFDWVRVRRAQ